jgi:hypothetical protein
MSLAEYFRQAPSPMTAALTDNRINFASVSLRRIEWKI